MDPDPQPYWQKLMFKVNAEDWTGQKLDVTTWEDEMSFLSWIVTAVTWLGNVLVTVLMVIVAVGIVNTLAIAIRERTREIGTLRAIGMQRTQVLRLTLLEAFLLGLCGALAGAALGAAVGAGAQRRRHRAARDDAVLPPAAEPAPRHPPRAGGHSTSPSSPPSPPSPRSGRPSYAARMRPVTAMHHVG